MLVTLREINRLPNIKLPCYIEKDKLRQLLFLKAQAFERKYFFFQQRLEPEKYSKSRVQQPAQIDKCDLSTIS